MQVFQCLTSFELDIINNSPKTWTKNSENLKGQGINYVVKTQVFNLKATLSRTPKQLPLPSQFSQKLTKH